MEHNYNAGNFRLEEINKKSNLYYNNEIFLSGCDAILQLTLEIGLDDFSSLERFDLTEEEIQWLLKMLTKHVLNGEMCVRK